MHFQGTSNVGATLTLTSEGKQELESRTVAPEFTSSCISRWTFSWVQPMMSLGNKKALEIQVGDGHTSCAFGACACRPASM